MFGLSDHFLISAESSVRPHEGLTDGASVGSEGQWLPGPVLYFVLPFALL